MTSGVAALDFIFEPAENIDSSTLLQGDLLARTPEFAETIGKAHAYYATADSYSHFLVLTQSCDLVRRKGTCKSRYITICAVRPLSLAFEREMEKHVEPIEGFPLTVGNLANQVLVRQFLERVLNNTVDGIFFIPKGAGETVEEHLCAFLPLSIALRAEHYDICLSAKVAQATSIFAAKIGSLTSGLYGRIATPDLSEKYGSRAAEKFRSAFFEELGIKNVAWLSSFQRRELVKRLEVREGGAGQLQKKEAAEILRALPSELQAIVERSIEVLVKRNLLPDDAETRRKAENFLVNDGTLTKLVREA